MLNDVSLIFYISSLREHIKQILQNGLEHRRSHLVDKYRIFQESNNN